MVDKASTKDKMSTLKPWKRSYTDKENCKSAINTSQNFEQDLTECCRQIEELKHIAYESKGSKILLRC